MGTGGWGQGSSGRGGTHTPVSEPAVKIHALADCAAETRPRSKATCSCDGRLKSCAPPVTVIRISVVVGGVPCSSVVGAGRGTCEHIAGGLGGGTEAELQYIGRRCICWSTRRRVIARAPTGAA